MIYIYKLGVALCMFKVLKFNQYPSLQNNLDIFYPGHDYTTRSADQLVLPFPRVAIRTSYKFQFVNICNKIPRSLRNLENVNKFMEKFYSYFLRKYQYCFLFRINIFLYFKYKYRSAIVHNFIIRVRKP